MLVLITPGGDAHAAFRVARCLQAQYEKFSVFVPGWCKSAGTLLVIGAHELILGDFGELGPIDVQRGKEDELWESSSGLTESAALKTLENAAFEMFGDYLFRIKQLSRGQVTFKTASEVATKLVIGQLQPVYAQIDPAKLGENTRAMQIGDDYGLRLAIESGNLLRGRESLATLVTSYSSHAFVIDRKEAADLFRVVKEPDTTFEELCEVLYDGAYRPIQQREEEPPTIRYISKEVHHAAEKPATKPQPGSSGQSGGDSGGTVGPTEADGSTKVATLRPARGEREG